MTMTIKESTCNMVRILILSSQFYCISCFLNECSNFGFKWRQYSERNARLKLRLHQIPTTTTLQDEVMLGLNHLYPPDDLSKRNSMSRTDGYWSYISNGEEPPIHLTYGEFDFFFFADLLKKADIYLQQQNQNLYTIHNADETSCLSGKTFVDIGSGTGRLVLGAAALHPHLKISKGIEILPGIHEGAIKILEKCSTLSNDMSKETSPNNHGDKKDMNTMTFTNEQWKDLSLGKSLNVPPPQKTYDDRENDPLDVPVEEKEQKMAKSHKLPCPCEEGSTKITKSLPLSPIKFSCGSFEDPYEYVGDADVVFVFSTCWTQDMMKSLAQCIGRQCKPGTIAITTEFPMPLSGVVEAVEDDPEVPFGEYEMELVEKLDGYCGVTGGVSTAYIHRVVESLYEEEVDQKIKSLQKNNYS